MIQKLTEKKNAKVPGVNVALNTIYIYIYKDRRNDRSQATRIYAYNAFCLSNIQNAMVHQFLEFNYH